MKEFLNRPMTPRETAIWYLAAGFGTILGFMIGRLA